MSGISSSENVAGMAPGRNAFNTRSMLNWPKRKPLVMASDQLAGRNCHRRLTTSRRWPTVASVCSRISRPLRPAAMPAPMMAPIDEPAMTTGRMPNSSKASMTWIWASPRAPPPPSANATDGSLAFDEISAAETPCFIDLHPSSAGSLTLQANQKCDVKRHGNGRNACGYRRTP
ncbi:hypothetical protein D3C72_1501400 [compost metagenome]